LRKITLAAAFITSLFLLISCASTSGSPSRTAKGAGGDELDHAIREISDYLNKRIPKGTKAVFLNVKSDWPDLSEYILDCLQVNAVNDEVFDVVDRQQLDAIRSELNFQWSGEVSDASAQEIGQMLGAQTIVSGSVTTIGSTYRIQARAIEVLTAKVQGQLNQNVDSKGNTVAALTKRVAPAGSGASNVTAGSRTNTAAAPVVPVVPTSYKIGDTGPAGGLIFYDKGNNNGGWRYMEAAPVEAEFQASWSVRNTVVENTEEVIGSGKRNTQLIVEKFKQTSGEWDTAAQMADDLVFNGFDDWFLPSKAELDQMYGNLKRRNLGDFKNGHYWASSMFSLRPYLQNFSDGQISDSWEPYLKRYVRPIRQF